MAGKVERIRRAIASCFEANRKPLSKREAIDWINAHFSDLHPGTLDQQLYRSCVNVKSAINSSAPKVLFYERATRTYRSSTELERREFDALYRSGSTSEMTPTDSGDEPEVNTTFALESHLRDYLARNLSLIESGLKLWTGDIEGSVEFAIEGRRIDILAKDIEGVPVVIELKLSKGHERTLGQALYYRGKLKQLLGAEKVRIIMVASEITDELKVGSSEVEDVSLFTYALTMQVDRVA